MIKKLYIDQGFRHFDRTFEFEKGLTGIVGKNEAGKSLIVEFIRYALFGSAALRGPSEDYKKLHVELWFSVKGSDYHVIRKGSKVILKRDGEDLASGTKPVNQAVVEALGYDMTVFDVANACNQGNVEALSNMRPAERKAMVDRTIGLDVLDNLIKVAGERALMFKRDADTIERTLVKPTEPTEPAGYRSSETVLRDLTVARELVATRNQLKGWLSQAPAQPVEPVECPVAETVAELEAYQRARRDILAKLEDLDRRIENIRLPKFPAEYLDQQAEQWVAYGYWLRKKSFLDQGHLCCPACHHEWPIAAESLKAFEDVVETEKPEISEMMIQEQRKLLGNQELLDSLIAQRDVIQIPADREADLRQRRQYEAAVAQYAAAFVAYEAYQRDYTAKHAKFMSLCDVEEQARGLEIEYRAALVYEQSLENFWSAEKAYEAGLAKAGEARRMADEYAEAKKRIQELKVQIKTHLLPSLNKVASLLLNQMTGGERCQVEIDEEFEILIDGQKLVTLSGSGKAVANLAIRIALGQILTNKVFSVFFADEVDASMDNDRAEYTAQALRRLTDLIGQVIIITHKRPETDHLIELTK